MSDDSSCSSDADTEDEDDKDEAVCANLQREEDLWELKAALSSELPDSHSLHTCACAAELGECLGRPSMAPRSKGAKVFSSGSLGGKSCPHTRPAGPP